MSYSRDLWERVVKASQDQTATQAEVGTTFGISVSTIQDWLKRYESTGAWSRYHAVMNNR
jgi:transposase